MFCVKIIYTQNNILIYYFNHIFHNITDTENKMTFILFY